MYGITQERLRVIVQTFELMREELAEAGLLTRVDNKFDQMIKDLETLSKYNVTGPLVG